MKLRRGSVLLVLVSLIVPWVGTGGPSGALAADPGSDKGIPPSAAPERPAQPSGSTDDGGNAPTAAPAGTVDTELADTLRRTNSTAVVTVEIVTTSATADAALAAVGASAVSSIGGVTLAALSPAQVRSLAAQPTVIAVRKPVELHRTAFAEPAPQRGLVTSENALSYDWISRGLDGRGVKVGIIDLFDPAVLTTQINSEEIPNVPASQRFCWWAGQSCTFGSPGYDHGNAVAEVLSDGAPGASLYLAEVGTLTDYRAAIDWFYAKGVKVINHSAGGPFDGPGDGTGPSAAVVDYAVSKGMAWFNAAGNANADPQYTTFAGGYWRGLWADADNDRWLNFKGTDESLTVYCGALMGLRWSDWGAGRTDYDLFVTDYRASTQSNSTNKVLASGYNQAAGSLPLEGNDMRWLCNTNSAYGPVYDTNKDGFVSLWVYRSTRTAASPTGDILELMVNQGWFEYSSSAGSAAIPFGDTRNSGAASVGAVAGYSGIAGFSSRGPTNDGRAKPDIAAPGCLSTSVAGPTYGGCENGFVGTSAAAPVAAGLAALGIGSFGFARPADAVSWLRSISTSIVGPTTKDNDEGWGVANRPAPPEPPKVAQGYTAIAPRRILDTRGVNGQPLGAPIGVRPADSITVVPMSTVAEGTLVLNVALVNATGPGYLQVYPTGYSAPGSTSNLNVSLAGQTRANLVIVTTGVGALSFYSSGGGHIIADLVGSFGPAQYSHPLVTLDPYEVYDSHDCDTCSGAPLADQSYVDVQLAGTAPASGPGVPAMTAPYEQPSAVVLAVTVSQPAGKGFLSVVPAGTTAFTTSNLNYQSGESLTTTSFVPVAVDTGGVARVYVSRSAHVKVDVVGYFGQQPRPTGIGYFNAVGPLRALDTRYGAKPGGGTSLEVAIPGHFGIPADYVGALFVNTTSTGATGPGFITAGPTADSEVYRTTSIPGTGQNVAAGGIVDLTDAGALRFHASVATHVVADISGWFTGREPAMPDGALTPLMENDGFDQIRNFDLSDDAGTIVVQRTMNYTTDRLLVWQQATGVTTELPITDPQARALRISGDGSTVFFDTVQPLLPADTDTMQDVYSYRIADGLLALESATLGSTYVFLLDISDDAGRMLIKTFVSLSAADTDAVEDLYLVDRTTGTATFASAGLPAGAGVNSAKLSADGTLVVFVDSWAWQMYRFDALTATTAISPTSGIDQTSEILLDISEDATIALMGDGSSAVPVNFATGFGLANPPFVLDIFAAPVPGSMSGDGTLQLDHRKYSSFIGLTGLPDQGDCVLYEYPARTATNLHRTFDGVTPHGGCSGKISDDGTTVVMFSGADNLSATSTDESGLYLVDLAAF